ncbi:MAG TPA: lipoate--protein ligase family protein [Chthonomonadales bacterium]|nr:lipoate--protein ligase family protein [Chthonomonadales bacterium]
MATIKEQTPKTASTHGNCGPPVKPEWRLLRDGEHSAAWNMAVDEAILDAVIEGIAPPTLRFYRWNESAISVGRFQSITRWIDTAACQALGVSIFRRPTGGRGILHGGDQTVSIVIPKHLLGPFGRSVIESYRYLSGGFVKGLARLNISISQGICEKAEGPGGDCFAVRSRADLLTLEGVKIVGSAQCRREGVILQQSSLRHQPPEVDPTQVFLGTVAADNYPLKDVDEEALLEALIAGFAEALEVTLRPGYLTAWEEERAGILIGNSARVSLVDSHSSL